MLIEIYLFLYSITFLFFLLMFFKEEKYVFGIISVIFFFTMAFLSGDIDLNYCGLMGNDTYSCHTVTTHYPELMWINSGLAVISIIYVFAFTLMGMRGGQGIG